MNSQIRQRGARARSGIICPVNTKDSPPEPAPRPSPLRPLLWAGAGAAAALALVFLVLGLRLTGEREPPGRVAPSKAAQGPAPTPRLTKKETRAALPPAASPGVPLETNGAAPDDLATEESAIARARDVLARGDALGTVYALNEYDEAYPNGTHRQDSIALRVEALVKAGHPDTARELATTFLRDFPASPHAKRVQAMVEK